METHLKISTKGLQAGIARLGSRLGLVTTQALLQAAHGINAKAQRRAPVRFGELINSTRVEPAGVSLEASRARTGAVRGARGVSAKAVRFGFDKSYADIMDRGWKTAIIRPKRAKALWIPLTRAAARQGPLRGALRTLRESGGGALSGGAARRRSRTTNSRRGQRRSRASTQIVDFGFGLKRNRKAREFIFAKSVRTRKAVKGSKIGPNFYFSGTLNDVTKDGSVERFVGRAIRQGLGT